MFKALVAPAGAFHKYVYPGVPPAGVTVADPFDAVQVALVDVVVNVNAGG